MKTSVLSYETFSPLHPSYLISLTQMDTRKLKTPCRKKFSDEKLKVHYEIQKLFGSIIYLEFSDFSFFLRQ